MHVLVMAKAPVAGRVKTRLCPPCTHEQAASIAAAALADTLAAVASTGADRRIIALDGSPGDWLPEGFTVIPQIPGPFGGRLEAAWATAGGPGIQIGMDTPQITSALLNDAMAVLDGEANCVLGHALDGGWWALGLSVPVADLFTGVPMSTDDTGRCQEQRCRDLGMDVHLLPTLRDVDYAEDALAVALEAPGTRFAATVRDVLGHPGSPP